MDERFRDHYCGWRDAASQKKICKHIVKARVFQFNQFTYVYGEAIQTLRTYNLWNTWFKKSVTVSACKCPTEPAI